MSHAAFTAELEAICLDKEAVDPLTLGLVGAGSHLLTNAGFKALSSTPTGHALEAAQMATGFQHAMKGRQLHPVARSVAEYGVGPESMLSYDAGQRMGSAIEGLGKGQQYRTLKKLRKNMAMSTALKEAPVARSVVPAVNRILSNEQGFVARNLPTVAAGAKPTLAQRAAGVALGAGAIAAEPSSAVHLGLNAARKAIATSEPGRAFMLEQLKKGVTGKPMPQSAAFAQDLAVSPGSRYARQMGEAIQREAVADAGRAGKLTKSLAGQVLDLPGVRRMVAEQAVPQGALSGGRRLLSRISRAAL